MFNREFLELPAAAIAADLRTRGYVAVERALDADAADAILRDVDDLRFEINRNAAPNVVSGAQTYATHIFARSKTAFDIVIHERVTSVLRAALGDQFRMVGKRVYETRSDHYMQFHSDVEKPCVDPAQIDAVVFIFYLNDVAQGEWEIVEGSHLWGERTVGSRAHDAALLARPDVTVKGLAMPKGSMVIYNGRLLHRARRFKDPDYRRRSFFFQTNRSAKSSEPILVDVGFIPADISDDARMLLGFGKPGQIASFPCSSVETLAWRKDRVLASYLAQALPVDELAALKATQAEAAPRPADVA